MSDVQEEHPNKIRHKGARDREKWKNIDCLEECLKMHERKIKGEDRIGWEYLPMYDVQMELLGIVGRREDVVRISQIFGLGLLRA